MQTMKGYQVARLLAYVTGLVNQELLLQVEYLVAENRILRAHEPVRLRLSNEERSTLTEIGRRLGRPVQPSYGLNPALLQHLARRYLRLVVLGDFCLGGMTLRRAHPPDVQ